MSEPIWQPRSNFSARLLGAGFFLGGAALVVYQIKVILDAVEAHAERITYFLAVFPLGGLGIAAGIYWMIRGLPGYTAMRSLQNNPAQRRKFTIVIVVLVVAILVGVKYWVSSLVAS